MKNQVKKAGWKTFGSDAFCLYFGEDSEDGENIAGILNKRSDGTWQLGDYDKLTEIISNANLPIRWNSLQDAKAQLKLYQFEF